MKYQKNKLRQLSKQQNNKINKQCNPQKRHNNQYNKNNMITKLLIIKMMILVINKLQACPYKKMIYVFKIKMKNQRMFKKLRLYQDKLMKIKYQMIQKEKIQQLTKE